ncbi:MAG: hypothetical protein ACAI44_03340 [Candidatus Sericytochromatia bacterium]
MADAFYHVSQLLFFALSAVLLYRLLQQNRALQDQMAASVSKSERHK